MTRTTTETTYKLHLSVGLQVLKDELIDCVSALTLIA